MLSILHYLLLNSRMILFTLFGLTTVFLIVGRISGLRFGWKHSLLAWLLFWCVRFLGFTLYISTYLPVQYSEETWFQWVFIIASLFNIVLGVFIIWLFFGGDLRKNLRLWLLMEILVSAAGLFPVVLVWGDAHIMNKPFNFHDPREFFIFIYYPLFMIGIWKLLNLTESWLDRFRNWQPGHTIIVDLVIGLYFTMGFFSNIGFVLTRGNVGMLGFSILAAIFLYILWALFLQKEHAKALDENRELIRQEAMLKNYYQQLNTQSSKIHHFNSEIRHSLDALMKTLTNPDEVPAEEKEADHHLRALAENYRQKLESHYRELTLSKYSSDPAVNDLLVSYEEKFRSLGVSVFYSFHRYRKPEGIKSSEIDSLLQFLLDEATEQYASQCKDNPASEEAASLSSEKNKQVFLQGGMTGDRLIISCEYQGQPLSGKKKIKLYQILRQMQADETFHVKEGNVKIIVGIG